MRMNTVGGVEILGPATARSAEVLTEQALQFIATLHRSFNPTRQQLLRERAARQEAMDAGAMPDFRPETEHIRESDWRISPVPSDLQDRRAEITGPVERKMMINALNSGARIFMADFEDSCSPAWENLIEGQANLIDAVRRRIEHINPDGKVYRLNERTATLLVRPRGWHLDEKHLQIDGEPIAAGLMDFGLYLFHNVRQLKVRGSGPYFYLAKLESAMEARLWNDVFTLAEEELDLPKGTIRATVLIETILAAFEMDEILYELREHAAGLNAGRWDYIFSVIKKFRNRPEFVLPDRALVTMTVPFMRAYTELLVKTCHKRGAHAIGGMAAFIPSRKDPVVNEKAITKVREDKIREAGDGFDGTWVAHPGLVPVATEVFDSVMGERPNQLDRMRDDVTVTAADLLEVSIPWGEVTEAGLRSNINVGIQYLESWLRGVGAAAIHNLMEDVATAEISRSQVWQWIRHGVRLADDGPQITPMLVHLLASEELAKIHQAVGEEAYLLGRYDEAHALFGEMVYADRFCEFLTLPAYNYLEHSKGER
jgi:malate synthase